MTAVPAGLDWRHLRTWNGSQQAAFEELCCQLAGYEPMPPGASFVRKGAPDAGVECYWTLPDGAEVGWQAKYFTTTPSDGQWRQVDESAWALHDFRECYSPKIDQQGYDRMFEYSEQLEDHGVFLRLNDTELH